MAEIELKVETTLLPRSQQRQQGGQHMGQQSLQGGQQRQKSAARRITGGRKRGRPQMTMHLPQISAIGMAEMADMRKKMLAQEEIQESSTTLVKDGLSRLATDENHKKRFKVEIDKSMAIPELLKDHLGWVSSLPSTLQLAALLGKKFVRSKIA